MNWPLPLNFCLCLLFCLTFVTRADESAEKNVARPMLEITSDITLDPDVTYGAIVVRASGITIDGNGAWLLGTTEPDSGVTKAFRGTAITADGFSNVTLRNINAKGWETGLVVRNAEGWTIENCNFSDNFHDPEFGWGRTGDAVESCSNTFESRY